MTMPVLGKADYRLLNVVALKKMASAGALAYATGLPPGQVEDRLGYLAGLGLVETLAGSALPSDGADPATVATRPSPARWDSRSST